MKRVFRYTVRVALPDTIQSENLLDVLEFNEVKNSIKVAYKSIRRDSWSIQGLSPDMIKAKIEKDRTVTIHILTTSTDLETALFEARNILENKLAILSFISVFPCKTLDEGNISEEISEGKESVEILTDTYEKSDIIPPFRIDDITLLCSPPEKKILNSLRWFRKGLLDDNLFDRFISLWIAFEMVSSKLRPTDYKKHMACPKCNEEFVKCPKCGEHTETNPVEKDGIIYHIRNNLKIEDKQYFDKLYNMRNDIFHGRSKSASLKPKDIKPEIEKLKYCLINAYWIILYGRLPIEPYEQNLIQRFNFLAQETYVSLNIELKKEGVEQLQKETDNLMQIGC